MYLHYEYFGDGLLAYEDTFSSPMYKYVCFQVVIFLVKYKSEYKTVRMKDNLELKPMKIRIFLLSLFKFNSSFFFRHTLTQLQKGNILLKRMSNAAEILLLGLVETIRNN